MSIEDKDTQIDSTSNIPKQPEISVEHFEETKTEREKLLGDKNISQQVETVLKTYEHTPAYKENLMRYLQKNESRKDKLLEELETLQGSENAIQQKIIEYLAMSCPDLIRQDISTTKSSNGTTTNAPENLNDRKKNTTIQTINQEQTTIEVDKTIKEIQQKMAAATELAKTDNITPTPEQTAQAEAQLKANGIRSQIEHNPLLSSNQELKNGYIYIFILSNLPINPLRTQTSLIVLSSIAGGKI